MSHEPLQTFREQMAQKPWTELDKYIELLLASKQPDMSVFVYLNSTTDGGPYDLEVC